MKDVMIDLETMGTGPRAAIVAIGAVEFDLETGELGREFYQNVNLRSSAAEGGVMDADTVMWWLRQSDEARKALIDRPSCGIFSALLEFSNWMHGWDKGDPCESPATDKLMWGNGAAFDNVILRSAYEFHNCATPWRFWNDRCYRTVKNMFPHIKMERAGTHHNALDDAISQAKHLCAMLNNRDECADETEPMSLPLSEEHPFGCPCEPCQERVR